MQPHIITTCIHRKSLRLSVQPVFAHLDPVVEAVGAIQVSGSVERQVVHRPLERARNCDAIQHRNDDQRNDCGKGGGVVLDGEERCIADERDEQASVDLVENLRMPFKRFSCTC
jgi:hypothetical protein